MSDSLTVAEATPPPLPVPPEFGSTDVETPGPRNASERHVWVLPVSGGYFPLQLAEILWLLPTCRPALVMGSSGGNIAAYLATAGAWTPDGVHDAIGHMYSGLFIKSWWPSYLPYLPSVLKGYFKGSAYDSNDAFVDVFQSLFEPEASRASLESTELWTGTYNTSAGATQLFCSRGEGDAGLHPTPQTYDLLNVIDPIYANNDTAMLARVCFASAAVPAVFPQQQINHSFYIDGGTAYSSPLTALRPALAKRYAAGTDLHLTYFSPYNIQAPAFTVCYEPIMKTNLAAPAECVPGTMYNQGVDAVSEILKSLMLQDRMAGVTLVGDPDGLVHTETAMSFADFQAFQARRLALPRSFVEVYPLSSDRISIVSFGPEDIEQAIASVEMLGVRAWLPAPTTTGSSF